MTTMTKQNPLEDLANAFLRGEPAGGDNKAHFAEGVFFSYAEPIAERLTAREVWITNQKFSTTTSKHTNALIRAASLAGMEIIRSPKAPRRDPNLAPIPPITREDARVVVDALRYWAPPAADPIALRRARALADVYEAAAAGDREAVAGLYAALQATGGK